MAHKQWGLSTHIDLFGCDVKKITSREKIQAFAYKLVRTLDMEAHGEPSVIWFGNGITEGYTMTQLLTTSCITAHFAEKHRRASFIDIFSCKEYDAEKVAIFCAEFFDATIYNMKEITRGGLS